MPDPLKQTLLHKVPGNSDVLYHTLLDLREFGNLHPHMTQVDILEAPQQDYVLYDITEELLLLGFIKNKPRYKAKVFEIEKNKHIRYTSDVKSNIFLRIDFILEKQDDHTLVKEEILIGGGKLTASIFYGILKKAHLQLFKNLCLKQKTTLLDKC